MSKSQKVVIAVFLILMGIFSFISATSFVRGHSDYYLKQHEFELYLLILFGLAFIGGGIFVLISKKRR